MNYSFLPDAAPTDHYHPPCGPWNQHSTATNAYHFAGEPKYQPGSSKQHGHYLAGGPKQHSTRSSPADNTWCCPESTTSASSTAAGCYHGKRCFNFLFFFLSHSPSPSTFDVGNRVDLFTCSHTEITDHN